MHDLNGTFTYDDFFRKTHAPLYKKSGGKIRTEMIYSSSAASMNMRHAMIHLTIDVALPLAIGVLLATELRVFTVQRNRSKSRAIRPGMASGVIRKLI